MPTTFHWMNGPWPGRLALSSRPRGGEWLDDEIKHWKDAGIGTVVSLLTKDEEADLDLQNEAASVKNAGMKFLSFPIPDRQVPASEAGVTATIEKLEAVLARGNSILVHCRQGIGRTGLIAASLLIMKGLSPGAAVEAVSAARGAAVPETPEQRRWIDHYATLLQLPNHAEPEVQLKHSSDLLPDDQRPATSNL
jgi:protein-tyrosine phosphatase